MPRWLHWRQEGRNRCKDEADAQQGVLDILNEGGRPGWLHVDPQPHVTAQHCIVEGG